jgi:hypothetical protein
MRSDRRVLVTAGVLIFVLLAGLGDAHGVLFENEKITVFVYDDRIRVEGVYTFSNDTPTPGPQGLFYPFPIDSLHPTVENVTVRMDSSDITFATATNGIGFSVPLPTSGMATVEVCYEQLCLDSAACYILTSTSTWNAPLREAQFEVHVPPSLELHASSYEFDDTTDKNGTRVYSFTRRNFLPEKDLCIRWRPRP